MADKPKKPREGDPGHRFQAQHPRYGGRKKRTAQMARDLADSLQCDPLEFMMRVINSDVIEQTVIENGKEKRVKVAIDLATRLDAAKNVAGYLYPRLSAQQISGKDDGPLAVAVATLDVAAILANPALAETAQQLAMLVIDEERRAEGLPEPDYTIHQERLAGVYCEASAHGCKWFSGKGLRPGACITHAGYYEVHPARVNRRGFVAAGFVWKAQWQCVADPCRLERGTAARIAGSG